MEDRGWLVGCLLAESWMSKRTYKTKMKLLTRIDGG